MKDAAGNLARRMCETPKKGAKNNIDNYPQQREEFNNNKVLYPPWVKKGLQKGKRTGHRNIYKDQKRTRQNNPMTLLILKAQGLGEGFFLPRGGGMSRRDYHSPLEALSRRKCCAGEPSARWCTWNSRRTCESGTDS